MIPYQDMLLARGLVLMLMFGLFVCLVILTGIWQSRMRRRHENAMTERPESMRAAS